MNSLSLAGKTALITGSGRENGVGAAIARTFARNGASVAIHYVSPSSKARAEKVCIDIRKEFATDAVVVHGPVQEQISAREIVRQAIVGLNVNCIDILVNNAGFADPRSLMQVTPEHLCNVFGVNAFASIYMTQAVVSVGNMPRGGRIINIGSIASKLCYETLGAYPAAKAAQDSLTTTWAAELGQTRGITVNTLAAGPIPTDASKHLLEKVDGSPSNLHLGMLTQTRAENRIGTVEDIADVALLIASERSRWITAQWISVSGGITGTM